MNAFREIKPENLNKNPFHLISKEWMLVTTQAGGVCNTMTASWGGLGHMWREDVAFIVLRPQRYTKELLDQTDTFSLSFFGDRYKKELGYLGKVSGRDENKIEKSGLTITSDKEVPYFEEASTVLFGQKLYAKQMEPSSFLIEDLIPTFYPEEDFHILYIAKITKILTKDDILL